MPRNPDLISDDEAENPIVAEFRYKFQYIHNKQQFAHIDSYQKAEDWLKEKLASEYARGMKDGREELAQDVDQKLRGLKQNFEVGDFLLDITDLQTFLKTIKV